MGVDFCSIMGVDDRRRTGAEPDISALDYTPRGGGN
jgi:hypothetical protein